MINNHDKISKNNAFIIAIGLIIFALSFIFIYMVGDSPEGFMGFLAPFTMLIGIIVLVIGFLYKADS